MAIEYAEKGNLAPVVSGAADDHGVFHASSPTYVTSGLPHISAEP